MAAIVSAMGIFTSEVEDMPLSHVNEERQWKFGHIAPFAGRIAVERLICPDRGPDKYVRIIANEALVKGLSCQSDNDGMCKLDAFVKSQKFARVDGQDKWRECFRDE